MPAADAPPYRLECYVVSHIEAGHRPKHHVHRRWVLMRVLMLACSEGSGGPMLCCAVTWRALHGISQPRHPCRLVSTRQAWCSMGVGGCGGSLDQASSPQPCLAFALPPSLPSPSLRPGPSCPLHASPCRYGVCSAGLNKPSDCTQPQHADMHLCYHPRSFLQASTSSLTTRPASSSPTS